MAITLGVAIYFILWWTVLFAVLPLGVRSHREAGEALPEGTDPGAPVLPQLARKVVITTIVSTVLFLAGYWVWTMGWVSIDSLPMPYGPLKL
jgi:predicted secreted protein